jgi:hypothetical protein
MYLSCIPSRSTAALDATRLSGSDPDMSLPNGSLAECGRRLSS